MLTGVRHEEIVDWLLPRPATCGSLFLNGDKIASLSASMQCWDALRRKRPSPGDSVRILWSMGDYLMFRLLFPYSRLEFELQKRLVTSATVAINWKSLEAVYGTSSDLLLPRHVNGTRISLGPNMLELPGRFYELALATAEQKSA